ncbi:MAG: hypothetical protein ACQETB_09115 [Halobacteriota archaeon]
MSAKETGRSDGESDQRADASSDADRGHAISTQQAEPTAFDARGWVLVAAVVACFLVVPGVIYLFPSVPSSSGLPFFTAFLVLPLVPAVLLGVIAVWSMRTGA